MTRPINCRARGRWDEEEGRMQLKPACYLVRRWTERERCCVCVRLRERACGRTGAAGLPWFSGVVILTVDPGRAVYFHPSPCEWRSNQAWDGLSSLSGWGMRGDGSQRHRAGPNHDGRTLNAAHRQVKAGGRDERNSEGDADKMEICVCGKRGCRNGEVTESEGRK